MIEVSLELNPLREKEEEKNWQLRELNPGCLTVAAITTEPRSHHSNQPSQFSFHTALVVLLSHSLTPARPHNCVDLNVLILTDYVNNLHFNI